MVVWIPNYHLNTGHLETGQVKVCFQMFPLLRCSLFRYPLYYSLESTQRVGFKLNYTWWHKTRVDQEKLWSTGRLLSRTRAGPTRLQRCPDWCQPLQNHPNFRFRPWTEKYRFLKAVPTPSAASALPTATNFWDNLTAKALAETEAGRISQRAGNTFLTRGVRVFVNKLFRFEGEPLQDE